MDTIALESYTIEFADHCQGVVQEGFFKDDKDLSMKVNRDPEGKVNVSTYKNYTLYTTGPNYPQTYADSFKTVAKGFVSKGPKYMQTAIRELTALKAYVEKNNAEFVEALAVNNNERTNNISNGIRDCVPTIIDTNRRWNKGDKDFIGETVEVSDSLRKEIKKFAEALLPIYNAALKEVARGKVEGYFSKSFIKKLFKSNKMKAEAMAKIYLWNELMLFCEDVMDIVNSAKQ